MRGARVLVTVALAASLPVAAWGLGTKPRAPRVGPVVARVSASPDTAAIGQSVRMTYEVRTPLGARVEFPARPANDSTWTWNAWQVEKAKETPQGVSHKITAVALPFRTGTIAVPAPAYRVQKSGEPAVTSSFPHLALVVVSVLPGGNPPDIKDLKPVFPSPWWATFPWWIVAVVLALAALLFFLLRRKKPVKAVEKAAAAPAVPAIPAHVEALAALDALVREKLPEQSRWIEHQTRLAAIMRRFLERRFGSPQPGYTTRELVRHLVASGLTSQDVDRLRALLSVSDLAKFARSEPPAETAKRQEIEARSLITAWAEQPPESSGAGMAKAS